MQNAEIGHMKFLVLGAGLMGRAVLYDLLQNESTERVWVADSSQRSLREARKYAKASDRRVRFVRVDIRDKGSLRRMMKDVDTVIGAVSYRFNEELTRLAISCGCHFCDLGGNNTVVNAQRKLNRMAKAKDVCVIPDCGLAPGMVSVLVAAGVGSMDSVDEVQIRVGGLPVHPQPPMNYALVFAVDGLINEYVEPCVKLRDGRVVTVRPMEEIETLEFPPPFGQLEAFNTSGGTSTLPVTYKKRVRNLDYKTIRYPGHAAQFRLLMDLGLTDSQPKTIGTMKIAPREVLSALLRNALSFDGPDAVLVRVTVDGIVKGEKKRRIFQIVDYGVPSKAITAMMRMTAFPISIIAQMMSAGQVFSRGVVPQEIAVPSHDFIQALRLRGVTIEDTISPRL